MTETEKKALALVNEVRAEHGGHPNGIIAKNTYAWDALCRAIEQHEAFKREVSDAVGGFWSYCNTTDTPFPQALDRFIIAKPDPLVEVMQEWWDADGYASIETFRAALAARGLEIREKQP